VPERWTDEECRTLARNRNLSVEQLSRLLPNRSIGAIEAALGGIDQYLQGRDVSGLLSGPCVAILEEELRRELDDNPPPSPDPWSGLHDARDSHRM
jgi:hypothetical protein